MEIETLLYQARSAAEHRPCGSTPCDREFPALPSKWCDRCLIAALLKGEPTMHTLEALIAKWREEANVLDNVALARAIHVRRCADELEATLLAQHAPEDCPCGWKESAREFANGLEYYRGLVDECAKHLGPEVFVSDDGSVQDSPLRAKVPELVAKLAAQHAPEAQGWQEKLHRVIVAWDTDDDMDFLASVTLARHALGLKLADEDEARADAEVLTANGYTANGDPLPATPLSREQEP